MPLEQAMSLHGGTRVLEADEPHYREVFDGILAALQGVSDRVEAAELGTAYVGLKRTGGDVRRRGPAGPGPAERRIPGPWSRGWVWPTASSPPTWRRRLAAPREPSGFLPNVRAFLAPHSINLLPVSSRLKEEMHRLGLHRMGAVASMSGHALSDRFGPEGRRAWELCNGIDHSPLVPMALEEAVVERTSLPFHTSSMEALLVAVDTLLRRAYARPDMKGRYAAAADLLCTAPGWPPWEKTIRFKLPPARGSGPPLP